MFGVEWMSMVNTTEECVRKRLLMEETEEINAGNLQDHLRILQKMCVYNLAPRGGTYEKFTSIDEIIFYH